MLARDCLAIPAVLRRRCGLRTGDRVLLAAVPGQDMLAAYSFAVVDQASHASTASVGRDWCAVLGRIVRDRCRQDSGENGMRFAEYYS